MNNGNASSVGSFDGFAQRWSQPPEPGDWVLRGIDYLDAIRQAIPSARLLETADNLSERFAICGWLGQHVHRLNQQLAQLVSECDRCFYPEARPSVQALTAPFAPDCKVDGICNVWVKPAIIIIDLGRIAPVDWLAAVAHEYAHAVVGQPGHDLQFQQVMTHLCLGLRLPPPPRQGLTAAAWEKWPPCRPNLGWRNFWTGQLGSASVQVAP